MKLTWRADTSASIARSSWDSRRRCRHSRISEPNGGLWTWAALVTRPVLRTAVDRSHYLTGNCVAYLGRGTCQGRRVRRRRCRRSIPSAIPRWLRFVLISDRAGSAAYIGAGFFFAPVLADAVAVADAHRGVLGDHRPGRAVARPARHRDGHRPRDGAADRRRDTGGLLALDHRLPDYCATALLRRAHDSRPASA